MFWAKQGAQIEINAQSPERVWLDIPLGDGSSVSGFNVLQVSVALDDLEKAIAKWREVRKVASHA